MEIGVGLSEVSDLQEVLDVVLREARRLAGAEAGALFIVEQDELRFVAAENDRLDLSAIGGKLLGRRIPLSSASLAGFVALTGRLTNIANSYDLPSGAPFRIDRDFDAATKYHTRSVLAVPLNRPDGSCVGVLELINHVDPAGGVGPFPDRGHESIRLLAAMAAVTIQNHLLQQRLKEAHLETILRLSVAGEFRDDDTGGHVRRISRTSALIAREMGLAAPQVELIRAASPMHDIGKIGIPDSILLKPGPLTAAERRIVETHPLIGADILAGPQNEFIAMARQIALTHHERWDGRGYPNGLAGEQIPLAGRIVGLADVLDALICKRCYKEPYPRQKALAVILEEKGKHFDPAVVDAFVRCQAGIIACYDVSAEAGEPAGRDD
ncbi:MAG: HD domain-containing phosphohydrolase [Phycisphaerae bacterium]